ncbi:RHS repeat-associated core domain-containing protein [Stenotrophomonas sp. JAG2]|uniref:RHS repeat-associated core domain-containing protein n=1 Tax=Stenotrophomonas sp. JAG2 TaxID=3229243 RepID=UPI0034E21237
MENRTTMLKDRIAASWRNMWAVCLVLLLAMLLSAPAGAQVSHSLNSTGSMGLAGTNGKFSVTVDDMEVKVPGGYVRINRDYDGNDWGFNRQWAGLGHPDRYQSTYVNLKTQTNCTTIDGVRSCDTTAGASTTPSNPLGNDWMRRATIPGDLYFGRTGIDQKPIDLALVHRAARKGVMFERTTGTNQFTSPKYPRFSLAQQTVQMLPPSTGPDAHPAAGRPGKGGVTTREVDGYHWKDRTGEWIEYDQFGRITSYGDRNDVRVWFQYGSQGQVERVLDDNGRTVYTLLYKDNGRFVTEARDHTQIDGKIRRVQYFYDGDGFMNRVIDARGGTTRYDYANTVPEPDSPFIEYPGYIFKGISKVTDASGRALSVEYGATRRVSKMTAADGGATEFDYGYDKSKKEFSLTVRWPQTEAGRKLETRRYDAEGRLVYHEVNGKVLLTSSGSIRNLTYTDERGNSTSVQRDAFDEVTRITYADGSSINYSYESASIDLKEFNDESGASWRFIRDAKGNIVERIAAAGTPEQQVTEYRRNDRGLVYSMLRKAHKDDENAVEVQLVHDANHNVIESVDGEGNRWHYTYDAQGRILKATDPLGRDWTYSYDAHGNMLTETDPNQNTIRSEYDASDALISTTDGRGKKIRYELDAMGRDSVLIDPYGAAFTDLFDASGRLSSRTDAAGNRSRLAYDNSHRLVKVTDGESFDTLFDYSDIDGVDRGASRASRITYPTFQRQFRYDNRNRTVQQTELLSQDTLVLGAKHDARGKLRALTNPAGKTQTFEYDSLGRTTAVVDELGVATRLGYDNLNNLVSVIDGRGNETKMTYDRRGLMTSETNPLGHTTRYFYDAAGNPKELLHHHGVKVVHAYDDAGRLIRSEARGADGATQTTHTFTWDAANNLIGWTSDGASASLTYDDADRLTAERLSIDGTPLAREYTYYANNKVRTYKGPDGVTLTYSYDRNGELSRVEIPDEGSISVTGWQWTAPTKVVLPGGSTQDFERDGHQQLTALKVRGPGQNVLFELENRFGKLRELSARVAEGKTTRFAYDDAMRLIKSTADYAAGDSQTYVLDSGGNRIEQSAISGVSKFDSANRLLERGTVSYVYDAAGNVRQRKDSALAEPARTTSYEYDGFNRLIRVRDGAESVVAQYTYDPFGYRLSKQVLIGRNGAQVGKTLYLHGEEGLLAEADASGRVMRAYGWHPEHDYSTYPLFQHADGSYFYYHNDHLGTPWRVTNKAGAIVWSAEDYSDFGTAKVASDASIVQPWRLPGQYLDVETGLHYNLQRYYESQTGRYISEDPLGFTSNNNFYAYARHSPTNMVDPTGEIIPLLGCLAWNYLRCVAACSVIDLAGQALLDPCNIDVGDTIKDCMVDCLWDMLPIPNPCGRLGKWLGTAMGVAEGVSAVNSFTADTVVATPRGNRRIEDLRPGDEVIAFAEWEGKARVEIVTDVILSHREQNIVRLTLESGNTVEATGGHPVHTREGWRAAQLLQAGSRLDVRDHDGTMRSVAIVSVDIRSQVVPVYNLEVSHSHTFFVGEDGLLVHNGVMSEPGTYEFPDNDHPGRYYSGKAGKLGDRTGKWKRKGRCDIAGLNPMPGSSDLDRRIQEQKQINARGGIWKPSLNDGSTSSSNLANPIAERDWTLHGIPKP